MAGTVRKVCASKRGLPLFYDRIGVCALGSKRAQELDPSLPPRFGCTGVTALFDACKLRDAMPDGEALDAEECVTA